jgi:hypothetical protein
MKIQAAQLLFSRVEPEYSPKKRSGYQVVYASPNLKADEITLIEKRVQCFQPKEGQTRRQFFILPAGQAVLTLSTLIDDPDPNVIDRSRRPGAFIAHAHVLSPAYFSAMRCDPFNLFQAHTSSSPFFIDTVEDLVDEISEPRPVLEYDLKDRPAPSLPEGWSEENLHRFYDLAQQVHTQGQQISLLLVGSEDQVEEALSFAHYVSLPATRRLLTFDSFADGCQPAPGSYWLVGMSKRVANARFLVVDLEGPRLPAVKKEDSLSRPKVIDYSRWWRSSAASWAASREQIITIQEIAQAFEDERPFNDESASAEAMRAFLRSYEEEAKAGLLAALEQHLSKRSAEILINDLGKLAETLYFGPEREGLLNLLGACSARRFEDLRLAAHVVYTWIYRHNPSGVKHELDRLEKLAKEAQHLPLLLVSAINTDKTWGFGVAQRNQLREETLEKLAQQPDILHKTLHRLCCRYPWASADKFISPGTAQQVADYLAEAQHVSSDELQAAAEALTKLNQPRALASLAPSVSRLERKAAAELHKRLSKRTEWQNNPFTHALERLL